ncbi:MAG: APC family permease [Proteobacteria bacterium]|nr:APC family permease [Pseudomonadota bacterium]
MNQRFKHVISRILFGKPIPTHESDHQHIGKAVGLAVFASDALSSVAYASQEILLILIAAGMGYLHLSIPIAGSIVALLLVLTLSYVQTIYAYPSGGGAYIVAKENLGFLAAQTAGAALLMDYILTVAVSISSGTDQIVSVFPNLLPYQVHLCIGIIIFMALMNLRGVKESGTAFALPTYFFLSMSFFTIIVGYWKWMTGTLDVVSGVEAVKSVSEPLSLFLILRAFSSGCTAVTGVEAISNGITAFKEPKSKNAAATMAWMSGILGVLFMSITILAYHIKAVPSEHETVISQIGRTIFERGYLYQMLMAGTTVILIMAANTSYADFPRLCALIAGDGFLPRQLTYKSSRLVFSTGVTFLSVCAGVLIFLFQAHTSSLIPLYAIGVFLSFTLSQWGMVIHWQKEGKAEGVTPPKHWRLKQVINAVGALTSGIVMMVFAITKFSQGAWITVIIIPSLIMLFYRIHRHYQKVIEFLQVPIKKTDVIPYSNMKTIILIDDVNTGTFRMIQFAKTLGKPWAALHVNFDEARSEAVRKKWYETIPDGELVTIHSPFRLLLEPITDYIESEKSKLPNGMIHVITGQLVLHSNFGPLLHSKNARGLYEELKKIDRVVVTSVPYHLH